MQNKYSKKQLEELYNCDIFKDSGFDDSRLFWVAQGLPFTEDGDNCLFVHADGWDLEKQLEGIVSYLMENKSKVNFGFLACYDNYIMFRTNKRI